MKIAISATAPSLEAAVDPRFGRCTCFVVVDPETSQWEAVGNSAGDSASGAGIQAAQTLAGTGAEVLLTGDAGPNAFRALTAGGIQVYTGASGTVQEAVEAWRTDKLSQAEAPTVAAHAGTVSPPATGNRARVAVATEGNYVAGHFGRCESYTIADIDGGVVRSQEEVRSPGHTPGALPVFLAERGVTCVVAGGMGPRAVNLFAAQGIDVLTGVQGTIDQVLSACAGGTLVSDPSASCCSQHSAGECTSH
ncbi:MAG: hypothetical protein COY42_26380 [Armatimonadetes bacterium CG_4_10_14_0_8_um_filter_66_14]|nr:MAG: hypothetical protein COY42_26380 [Armatimonadetes bacterium CG_4_10_14_0_8_um_filter_66_14]